MNNTMLDEFIRGRSVETVCIPERFCGPPESANGGYACGLAARALDGPAEVTLKSPPPLDAPLALVKDDAGARLWNGDIEVAAAKPCVVDMPTPNAPSFVDAGEAMTRYVDAQAHPLPECFVCGPLRSQGDGLRIFAGPDLRKTTAAACWIPEKQHAREDGLIAPEIIWAALDCPGYFGLMAPGLIALLGRMAADIVEAPKADAPCIVLGWRLGQEGRKHFAGSALYDASGRLLAKAKATWIEIRR